MVNRLRLVSLLTLLGFVSVQVLGVGVVQAETVNMGYGASFPLHAPKNVNGVDFQYDLNGNLENDGERVLSWNQDNLPVRIIKDGVEVNLFYDADGRRIVKQTGQERTTYPNQFLTMEQFNNEAISTKYYFAGDRRISTSDGSFYHQDYLGSTVLATKTDSQPISQSLSYFPYGTLVNNETMKQFNNSSYLFTGQELDDESALYNYNARLYNPNTGVFVSADKIQGANRFAYAANNPLLYTDPTGNVYEAGAGGGGGQDADETLQYTVSGGGGYQPPEIRATGVIGPLDIPESWFLAGALPIVAGFMGAAAVAFGPELAGPVVGACRLGPAWCAGAVGRIGAELAAPPGADLGPSPVLQAGSLYFKSRAGATLAVRMGEDFPAGGKGEFGALQVLHGVDPTHTVRPVQLTESGIWMERLDMELLDYLSANPLEKGRMLAEVKGTLARYHAAGLYHGDVNVQNVMTRRGTPVFIDPLEQRPHLVGGMQQIDMERLEGTFEYIGAFLSRLIGGP